MTFVEILPSVNATLNATSAVLLLLGRRAAAKRDVPVHRGFMLAALGTSSVFLVLYLTRYYLTGTHHFIGPEPLRILYLLILFTHMALAVATVPLVFRSIFLGLKNRVAEHRRLVRFTYPIWMYVSVTGVVVYVMLYHLSGR